LSRKKATMVRESSYTSGTSTAPLLGDTIGADFDRR
jgi:hypothetical protein